MKVAVVDYGSGNLTSASRALALAAERAGLDAEVRVTADPDYVAGADRIVLPGQGAFADCARGLAAVAGMRQAIERATARRHAVPRHLRRHAAHGRARAGARGHARLRLDRRRDRRDGRRRACGCRRWAGTRWISFRASHKLLDGLTPGDHVYFVHSYALVGGDPREAIAMTDYGGPVVAIVAAGNRAGTQFHVEKSQEVGIRILSNFLRWTP